MEDQSEESSLLRATKQPSKKRTAGAREVEGSGRILVLNEIKGHLTPEKATADGIDFNQEPWNDEGNIFIWVENPNDVDDAFGYFNHRSELTGGQSTSLFGVEIEAYHGEAIRSAEHFSTVSGKAVCDHWEHFKERRDHDDFMRHLDELIAEGHDISTDS